MAALAALAVVALLPVVASQTAEAVDTSSWSWNLATGLKLTRIRYSTPHEIRVLTVIPADGPRIDTMTGGAILGGTRRVSVQSSKVASNSVAGINGDFVAGPGFPAHALLVDGELWSSGGSGRGMALAVTANGARAWVGSPSLSMELVSGNGSRLVRVSGWNSPRESGAQAIGYTRRGGYIAQPPGVASPTASDPHWCAARLVPLSGPGWDGAKKRAIVRTYQVQAQPEPCEKTPLSLGSDPDAVVLAARAGTVPGERIRALNVGATVSMSWAFVGWPGVVDVIGGNPQVVDDGANVAPPYSSSDYLTGTHPRTAAGVSRGCTDDTTSTVCKIFLMTVDGRQSADGWSAGMRLRELADELLKLKAWDAMNLDGGGSTTMWVRRKSDAYCQRYPSIGGCLVNRPSGSERNVINGIAVLTGTDDATPSGLR